MPTITADIIQVHPFRLKKGIIEHLLLLRSSTVEHSPSIWQVITARCLPEERGVRTARRELLEETGLEASEWYALPEPAIFYFEPTDQVVLSPVFACRVDENAEVRLSEEHTGFCWLTADETRSRLVYSSHVQGVHAVERIVRDDAVGRHYRSSE